jgi:hypothetical protein
MVAATAATSVVTSGVDLIIAWEACEERAIPDV